MNTYPAKKSIGLLIASLLICLSLGAEENAQASLTWRLRQDFVTTPELTNPMGDRHGNGAVWHFLETTRHDGPVESRRWMRDGRYTHLPALISKRFANPRDGWIAKSFPPIEPSVGRYSRDENKGLAVKTGDIVIAPGLEGAVIVAWRSPVSGVAEIQGAFEHTDNCCGVNSQIDWYVERGSAPDELDGFAATTLASGTCDFGTGSARGDFRLEDQRVHEGDFFYFIVDARADGSRTPELGDGTRLDVTVTVSDAPARPTLTFEEDVRPILATHCHACHGVEKQQALLDLRTVTTILQGGKSGHALVPGSPVTSVLLDTLRSRKVPPGDAHKLDWGEFEILWRWVKQGVPARESIVHLPEKETVSSEDRAFWAFRPPQKSEVPAFDTTHRARTPIDAFLLARLSEKNLGMSDDADRVASIRRLSFDLRGLPPTPQEVDTFVSDESPDAYERLVDRFLASPHFGERWGRHWLDVAGYVDNLNDTTGVFGIRGAAGISLYRDFVIRTFNEDQPYTKFVLQQVAGDELVDRENAKSYTPEEVENLVATGYLRVQDNTGAVQYGLDERYKVLYRVMEKVTTGLLGLTMECCRCHDHKYDPIAQRDYYRLMACFETAYNSRSGWIMDDARFLADVPPAIQAGIDAHNASVESQAKNIEADRKKEEDALAANQGDAGTEKAQARVLELNAKIERLRASRRGYRKIQSVWDLGPEPVSRLFHRGDHEDLRARVAPGFPAVLTSAGTTHVSRPAEARGSTSGRRLALARWLTRPDHPLTGRVFVNRVWHHLFGRGIVDTPGNFGRSGSAPTHPKLLDWLTVDFAENGSSIKRLIRQILLSTAYRQSSRRGDLSEDTRSEDTRSENTVSIPTRAEHLDPENRLLWRGNLRRLESEIIRDTVLAVSGRLDKTFGGTAVKISTPGMGPSTIEAKPTPTSNRRRSLYIFADRVYPLTFLEVFDSPIMPVNCTARKRTSTVLQSLTFLNSKFVMEEGRALADRIDRQCDGDNAARVRELYRVTLSREPTTTELADCAKFLSDQAKPDAENGSADSAPKDRGTPGLANLAHMLLCTNEFLYIE